MQAASPSWNARSLPHRPATPGRHKPSGEQTRRANRLRTKSANESPSAPPQTPEPPARPTASRRSGRRHAVLRRCAEAVQTASSSWKARSLPHRSDTPRRHKPSGEQASRRTTSHRTTPIRNATWTQESHRAPRLRPPNRLPARPLQEEAIGGMRCCGGVLKRRTREAMHCAEPAAPNRRPTTARAAKKEPRAQGRRNWSEAHGKEPQPLTNCRNATPQTPEPPAHPTTSRTKWSVACGAAEVC